MRSVRRMPMVAVISLVGSLTACSGTVGGGETSTGSAEAVEFSPASSGELHLYTWSDYFPVDLAAKFEEETGISVTIDYYENNEALMTKLEAGGSTGYDVVVPSDYAVKMMADKGQLEAINALDLPNGQNILADHREPYFDPGRVYTAPYLYGTTGFMYDSALLADGVEGPKSWADYFAAQAPFAGKIGIFNDQTDGVNAALRAVGAEPCTEDPDDLQAAQDLLLEFKSKVNTVSSDSVLDRLITGDNSMAMIWNGASHRALVDRDTLVYVYATEGVSSFQDNWAIPKGAENVQQALTFINWMLDPANAVQAADYQGYNAAIEGVDELLSSELQADPAIVPPASAKIELVEVCSNEAQNNYTQIWETFKG